MQNQISTKQSFEIPRVSAFNRCYDCIERSRIIEEALSWEGVKFKHQGRSKKTGVDCAGLLIGVARTLHLDKCVGFKDFRSYARMPNNDLMKQLLDTFMIRVDRSDELPGDFYHMAFLKNPQHLAMILPDNEIIHSASSFGKVVRHRLDSVWSFTIHGVYRYKGII